MTDQTKLLREALQSLEHANGLYAGQGHIKAVELIRAALSAPAQTSQAKTPASGEAVKRWSVNLDGYVVADPQGAWVRYADITPPASQEHADDSIKFVGIDDTSEMGRVRRLLEAEGIRMSSRFIAQIVAASQEQAQPSGNN